MLDAPKSLAEDPAELRAFTALSGTEVKAQAVLIQKLQHQLAGHRALMSDNHLGRRTRWLTLYTRRWQSLSCVATW